MLCVADTVSPCLIFKEKPRSCSWYQEPLRVDMHRSRCNSLPMRQNFLPPPLPTVRQHNDLWLQWYRRLREHAVGHSLSWPELCDTVIETHHDVRIPLDTVEAEDLSWSLEEEEEEATMLDVLSALSQSSLPPLKIPPLSTNLVTMSPTKILMIEEEEEERVPSPSSPRRLLHGIKRAFKRRSPRRGLKALQRSVSERRLHFSGNPRHQPQQQQQQQRVYSQTPRGQSSTDGMWPPTPHLTHE